MSCHDGGASLPRLTAAHVPGAVLGTPALRRATIAVRPRRSATSTGERPSLSLVATLAPRARSSGTTRSMPAAAARCRKVVAWPRGYGLRTGSWIAAGDSHADTSHLLVVRKVVSKVVSK